jgi:DNA-directed RNA polymerase specialized sigma24 family protein
VKLNGEKWNKGVGNDNTRLQLEMISRSSLAGLVAYARRRLLRIGLDPNLAEDITQDAFRAILIGLDTAKAGRHPREIDVQDQGAFVDYLCGVINSLVAYERAKRLYQFDHEPIEARAAWEDEPQPQNELRSAASVESEIGWRDLQDVFFARLRPRVHPRIQHILTDWEWEWRWAAQIPVPIPERRFRRTIRDLAKEVLAELGEALAT